jgi:hypothetical protein
MSFGSPVSRVSIVTVTLGRSCLEQCCASVDSQSFTSWHHYVLGDGIQPATFQQAKRSTLGFSDAIGASEPAQNMPDGTPNPLLRWAIRHLDLAPYLCFLDDDNTYRRDFLAKMVYALDSRPDVGIVLCAVENRRGNWHDIDGYPEYRRCDNSGFLVRRECAKAVGFPDASPSCECVQDYVFIRTVAERFGWTRISDRLTVFGSSDNVPPGRGGVRVVFSWALPVRGAEHVRAGNTKEGLILLEKSVEFDPCDAWAWWHLGEARLIAHDLEGCRLAWRRYIWLLDGLSGLPDDWTQYTYALAALALGEKGLASKLLAEAVAVAKQSGQSERVLRADNQLNLALYAAFSGSIAEVALHWQEAVTAGLDPYLCEAISWKLSILRAVHLAIGVHTSSNALCKYEGYLETLKIVGAVKLGP